MQSVTTTSWPADTLAVQVGDIEVDLRFRRLKTPTTELELPSRVFDVFVLFLSEPNRLHTREALLARIWTGVFVEDGNVTQTVWMLRRLLGEERKHWIRTVAKSGYVFEPPGAITPMTLPPSSPADVPAATTVPPEPAPPAVSRWRSWRAAVIGALGAITLVAAAYWLIQPAPPAPIRRIALITVTDPGAGSEAQWPVSVARAWLEWQLSLAPEVVVLNAADLAASSDAGAVETVMLSATHDKNGGLRLQARRQDKPLQETSGDLAQADQVIDRLSGTVLADLLPQRATESRPALQLSPASAQQFAQALALRERREWALYREALRGVVEQTPEFGLARLYLAQSLASVGQASAAEEQLVRLEDWTRQWPPQARSILDAQRLALTQHHAEAVRAFAELNQRFPNQPQFALDLARAMLRAGQASDAIALLSSPYWDGQPVATRILALLNLSAAHSVMGDATRAQTSAQLARDLAVTAGWKYETALSAHALAMAQWLRREGPEMAAQFDEVARQFDASADTLRAQRSRYYADLADPAREPTHLAELLAAARVAGDHLIELDALRRAAFKYQRLGDFAAARRYLDELAELAARRDARVTLNAAEYDRSEIDSLQGDYHTSLKRAQALRSESGLGGLRPSLDLLIAENTRRLGQLDASAQAVETADPGGALVDRARRGEAPETAFSLACMRGTLALMRGDTPAAQSGYSRCAMATDNSLGLFGRLGEAEIAALVGDQPQARTLLQQIQPQLSTITVLSNRWSLAIEWAALSVRAGQADEALREILPLRAPVAASGLNRLQIDLELTLGEAALAKGEFDAAQEYFAGVRARVLPDDWIAQRRLQLAEAWMAYQRGQRETAQAIAAQLHAEAERVGDVPAELLSHDLQQRLNLLSSCTAARHAELLARSGQRGATLEWLADSGRQRAE
ncbi:MAG: winged helix-turn-helix domain-containing protein [Rhodanobacteraceae bacterium]|nr:winged helix-turn-helix domain-containing protein [Rhodanobacteraceae bacterium]